MVGLYGGYPWVMADGRVLTLLFGNGADEVFDPVSATFAASPGPSLPAGSYFASVFAGRLVVFAPGNRVYLYDPVARKVSRAGGVSIDRTDFDQVALADGRVLMLGGTDRANNYVTAAEIYDPATGKTATTGSIREGRESFSATLLKSGDVLIAGGERQADPDDVLLTSAEIYNPATAKFTKTGSLHTPRSRFNAILLQDGRVLVVGGMGEGNMPLASAEIYDPSTGKFTKTGSMSIPRAYFTSTLLPDGRVLIAGGDELEPPYYASAEIYDPHTGTFTRTGSMLEPRAEQYAFLLPDGRVLIYGGLNSSGYLTSAELYWP
jgi:hypothetical protein